MTKHSMALNTQLKHQGLVYVEAGEVVIQDENELINRIVSTNEYYDNNYN